MARALEDIQKEVLALDFNGKNELLKSLISDLDIEADADVDVEKLWLQEAQTRYAELKSGRVKAIPIVQVLAAARSKLNK
ncbi:MAG: addiction module protein [Xanthomonadales bacterium]|nr:addiction module protein [Xanthomonadales bacterium]